MRAGFVTIAESGLNVLICLREGEYDFDFEDTIVDLDIHLSEEFPRCSTEVLQIPNQGSLTSELPDEAMLVYGDGSGSSTTG